MNVGRRIIFEKNTGKLVIDLGEMSGEVTPREALSELDYIDLAYGEDADKFFRVKSYHIDPMTRKVVFDELYPEQPSKEEFENAWLIAQGVI